MTLNQIFAEHKEYKVIRQLDFIPQKAKESIQLRKLLNKNKIFNLFYFTEFHLNLENFYLNSYLGINKILILIKNFKENK